MLTPREWVRICELEKAAVEHQSVEKWIEMLHIGADSHGQPRILPLPDT